MFLFSLAVASLPGCRAHTGAPDRATVGAILSSAETTFHAMRDREYPAIWARLSSVSRKTIVEETRTIIVKSGNGEVTAEDIAEDFREGGPVSGSYWDGFLRRFSPRAALEESRWEMGEVRGDSAAILITHERADRPAVLRLFHEDGAWKVGLVETFWGQPVR